MKTTHEHDREMSVIFPGNPRWAIRAMLIGIGLQSILFAAVATMATGHYIQ